MPPKSAPNADLVAQGGAESYPRGHLRQTHFIVRLADLERGKKHYEWELPLNWLQHCFENTDACPVKVGSLIFEATKTGHQVLIRGWARASVTMPCARTLEPVPVDLDAELFLVLHPAATAHEGAKPSVSSATKKAPGADAAATAVTRSKRKPVARPEAELSEDEAAEDCYHGDHIELDAFLREFLLLELPMMPVRSDLLSESRPAIHPTPEAPIGGESPTVVDPRLQPLAEIASRLRKTTKE